MNKNIQDKNNNAKSLLGGAIIVTNDDKVIVNDDVLSTANRLLDDLTGMTDTTLNEKSTNDLARTVAHVSAMLSRYNKNAYKSSSNALIACGLLALLHNLTCNLMNRYEEDNANDGNEGEGNIDPNGNIIVDDDDNPF